MVILMVTSFARGMDGNVSRTPVALHELTGEVQGQPLSLVWRQLRRQGDLELTRHRRVLALLRLLGSVPECRPVGGPLGRPVRQDQLGRFDTALAAVIVDFSGPLVGDFHPGAIGRGSGR